MATSGTWLAVRGNCVRAVCAELAGAELVESVPAAGVCVEAVEAATGALPIAGMAGVAIERGDDAIVPSCVVPVGVAAVGAALALTSVSCPLEPTRDSSAVLVCSVVVVCASVVSTG